MEALFIFFDLEAAHGDKFFGDIIEIGALVDPRVLKNAAFQSLIKTNQKLSYFTLKRCCIKQSDLVNQKSFIEVFTEFLCWIKVMTENASSFHKKQFYPVLVAHGGFENDFIMIQGNMHRYGMDINLLSDLSFADTYCLARTLREKGIKDLQGTHLSIKDLLQKFFPDQTFHGFHRALNDVGFMVKIFLESPLEIWFSEIEISTFNNRQTNFISCATSKENSETLKAVMPAGLPKVTHTMTLKRLLRNGLTHDRLKEVFQSSVSFLDFYDKMKEIGISRKASKSLAAQLSAMGVECTGNDESFNDSGIKSCKKAAKLSADHFYSMFSDDFFSAPNDYEYEFGTFTREEIQSMDNHFENLFYTTYGNLCLKTRSNISKSTAIPARKNKCNFKNTENQCSVSKINESCKEKVEHTLKDKNNEESENWELDISDVNVEFELPLNRGPLAKVIPIGMTEDCFNGLSYSARVPLFKYFSDVDLKARPKGGFPIPHKKVLHKKERTLNTKNAAFRDELFHDSSRTVVKAKDGEVYILL